MKYTINNTMWFGYDATVYDSEQMARIEIHGLEPYQSEHKYPMTKEEMMSFAIERKMHLLEKMNIEIQKIQTTYQSKIKEIEKFAKSLDN